MSFEIQQHNNERNFETQFNQPELIIVGTDKIEVVDIFPEELKDEVPIIIAPGWGCSIDLYKGSLRVLTGEGRRSMTLSHPRHGGNSESTPTEEFRKASNLIEVLRHKDISKTDVLAHSEGAINAVIAATLYPEKFRNLVMYAPAGLIGQDFFLRLMRDFTKSLGKNLISDGIDFTREERDRIVEITTGTMRYIAENPVRALNEAVEISSSDTRLMLRNLHEKGICIVVISGVDDEVFPMAKIQQVASLDYLDGFLSVKGSHYDMQIHPELYVGSVVAVLEKLKEKNKVSSEK